MPKIDKKKKEIVSKVKSTTPKSNSKSQTRTTSAKSSTIKTSGSKKATSTKRKVTTPEKRSSGNNILYSKNKTTSATSTKTTTIAQEDMNRPPGLSETIVQKSKKQEKVYNSFFDNRAKIIGISGLLTILALSLTTLALLKGRIDSENIDQPREDESVILSLEPVSISVNAGEEFELSLFANSYTSDLRVYELNVHIRFNPDELMINDVNKGFLKGEFPSIDNGTAIDNSSGRIHIDWNRIPLETYGFIGRKRVATIKMTALTEGNKNIRIMSTADIGSRSELISRAILSNGNQAFVGGVTATVAASPNPALPPVEDSEIDDNSDETSVDNNQQTNPTPSAGDLNYCVNDSDCVKTSSKCCGCNEGGDEVAINQSYLDEFRNSLNCDRNLLCLQVYRCSDSEPECINNTCTLNGQVYDGDFSGMSNLSSAGVTDVNGDGVVSLMDYVLFMDDLKRCLSGAYCDPRSDFNLDGTIDDVDFKIFMDVYSASL